MSKDKYNKLSVFEAKVYEGRKEIEVFLKNLQPKQRYSLLPIACECCPNDF